MTLSKYFKNRVEELTFLLSFVGFGVSFSGLIVGVIFSNLLLYVMSFLFLLFCYGVIIWTTDNLVKRAERGRKNETRR